MSILTKLELWKARKFAWACVSGLPRRHVCVCERQWDKRAVALTAEMNWFHWCRISNATEK